MDLADCRSELLAAMRSPTALRQHILPSMQLLTCYPVQRFRNAQPECQVASSVSLRTCAAGQSSCSRVAVFAYRDDRGGQCTAMLPRFGSSGANIWAKKAAHLPPHLLGNYAALSAATIRLKSAAFIDAPPTNAPSTLGSANIAAALSGLTEPPYSRRIASPSVPKRSLS